MKLVTVDVSKTIAPIPAPLKLAIMLNRTVKYIAAWRAKNDENNKIFVLNFSTGTVEECHDFSQKDDHTWPFYVGNLTPMDLAMQQIIDQFTSPHPHWDWPFDVVLDERG